MATEPNLIVIDPAT
jgi:hypothetical protein